MEREYYIPYAKLAKGKRIILYGAGKVGKLFWYELFLNRQFDIVGWVDKYNHEICDEQIEIKNVEWLLKQDYDLILIAIANRNRAYSAMIELKQRGIDECKMVWEDYRSSSYFQQPLDTDKELQILKKIEAMLPTVEEIEIHNIKEKSFNNVIWTCWLQGFENAPEIVKKCNIQLKKMAHVHAVIEITLENVNEYIDIPDYVWKKYNEGKICNAHFADIIRVMLLAQYGGLWVDATCLFTNVVPEYYFEYPFFAFQSPMCFYAGVRLASNWLLASTPNNDLILWLEKYMLEWWKQNDNAVDYFLMHYLMYLAVFHNLRTYEIWNQLDYYDNVTPHILQHDFNRIFDKTRFEYVCNLTPVHKLTYRYKEVDEDSVLAFLLESK